MPRLDRRSLPRRRTWARRIGAVGAAGALTTAMLWCAGCTGGSGGTQILQSTARTSSAGTPGTAVTISARAPGTTQAARSGSVSVAVTASSTTVRATVTASPTTVRATVTASSAGSGTSGTAGTGSRAAADSVTASTHLCHDPDHPDLIRDCGAPPTPTFPGSHAAYVTAITACMADKGWPGARLDHGSITPATSRTPSQQFGDAALACLHQVGIFAIAHASDAEIAHDYRQLRDQWTCLKDQGLAVQPFPTLKQVLARFHRTHRFTLDPLAGLPDRSVGLSWCPAPQIPGRPTEPPTPPARPSH